jgi:hypothetical protein
MCGPIFDTIGNNQKSKIAEETPEARKHQASRGYVTEYTPKPSARQVTPARARAAMLPSQAQHVRELVLA